ncbi:MAG: protein-disulfide reductase DsbD domain-containing protein [Planctomycetota bacterium]
MGTTLSDIACTTAALISLPLFATGVLAQDVNDHPATAELISELKAFHPGTTQLIGLRFTMEPSWHIYWAGQNDTGMAPTVELDLPEGFVAGEILWPTPHRYVSPGDILDHVYEGEITLLIPLTIDSTVEPGSTTIDASLEWLVCSDVCIPGWDDASISLPVASTGEEPSPGEGFASIHKSRAALAIPAPETQVDFTTAWQGEALTISPRGPVERVSFFPGPGSLFVESLLTSGEAKDGPLTLNFDTDGAPVEGVIGSSSAPRTKAARGIIEIQRSPTAPPTRYTVSIPMPDPVMGPPERER